MHVTRKQTVLILGADSGATEEMGLAITKRCGDKVELRYATNNREAQRAVRRELFVAIVAVDGSFLGFCDIMTPDMAKFGGTVDVVICPFSADYEDEMAPDGITVFTSVEAAADDVLLAVDYQTAQDDAAGEKIG